MRAGRIRFSPGRAGPLVLALLAAAPAGSADGPRRLRPGSAAAPFDVKDLTGASHRVFGDPEARVVVLAFSAVRCPVAKAQAPRIAALTREFGARGVRVLVVYPNPGDARSDVAEAAARAGISAPLVLDVRQEIARRFGVERTTEILVFEGTGKLRYRGAFDDQHSVGLQKPAPTRHFAREAVAALLEGNDPPVTETTAKGCLIEGAAARGAQDADAAAPTYHADVAPILRRRCVECHAPGEVGPMSLLTYGDASAVAQMIGEVVENRRMPPWHADPAFGSWRNDRRLDDAERTTILRWVAAGAPPGTPPPESLDAPLPPRDGRFRIGKPDLVVRAPKQRIPATGVLEYRYASVPTELTEDRWVAKAEIHAGDPSVVHHILVFCQYPPERRHEQPPIDGGLEGGFFASLVPGERPTEYPPDAGKLLPAGSKILFQIHYTANGVATEDVSEVGFVFHPSKPAKTVTTRGIAQRRLRIEPGDAAAVFRARYRVPKDVEILSFLPHMHFRGKSFRYDLTGPGGARETLLAIPRYDFNWQATYHAARPIPVPAGSVVECTAVFDNSTANPANPDPGALVKWGDQTWDEMMIGYVDTVER